MYEDFYHFCEWTGLDADSKEAALAWVNYNDQDEFGLAEWWAEYQGEYT